MKKIALCIAALLLAHPAYADEVKTIRTISVSGLAERDVIPDEAHITVNLNSIDFKLATAKSAHDAKLKKLLTIAANAGIDNKKIKTNVSSIEPIYTYEAVPATGQSKSIFKGYRAQTILDMTVTDTKKTGDLMDTISRAGFETGANTEWGNLLNLYYTISNPDKIRDELLIEAIKNAKAKAENIAQASGARIARVYQINEGNVPQFQPVFGLQAQLKTSQTDAALINTAPTPPAGEQKLQTTVSVIYELE